MDMDKILSDMRQHISNLQDKLQLANSAVNNGQIVNERITLMKEYQDKIASLNSCWRARKRTQLVHNLQQESRQILALEEENRQLRFALKEMEDGLHLIMNDYRKVISDFMRADALTDVANAQNKKVFIVGVSYEQYIGIARAAEKFMSIAESKIAEGDEGGQNEAPIAPACTARSRRRLGKQYSLGEDPQTSGEGGSLLPACDYLLVLHSGLPEHPVITQLRLENQTLRALFYGLSLPSLKQTQKLAFNPIKDAECEPRE